MSQTLRFQNIPARVGQTKARRAVRSLLEGDPLAVAFSEGVHLENDFPVVTDYQVLETTDRATPVIVRPDVEVTGLREQLAYPPTWVGKWGAGPDVMAAAVPHLHRLEAEGEEPVWFGPSHLVPSVMRRAVTKRQKANQARRRVLHELEVRELIATARGLSRVVLVADWNAGDRYPSIQLLKAAGFTIVRDANIDYWAVKGVQVLSSRALPHNGSDHPGVELTFS